MAIPKGKQVVYKGQPHYWAGDNNCSKEWTIFPGDKGIIIDTCKLIKKIGGKPYQFYPYKWKGFCFGINKEEYIEQNTIKQLSLF